MIVASHGIISVLRKTKKRRFRPRKARNAKAYAAKLAVSSWPITTAVETMKLLRRYRPIGMLASTAAQWSRFGAFGKSGGGNVGISDRPSNVEENARSSGKGMTS